MSLQFLHFATETTTPAVAIGLYEQPCDRGPVRLDCLGAIDWAALIANEDINGCGPKGFGGLVPDLTAEMEADGLLHDIDYLIGGTAADRDRANERFARRSPTLYGAAVKLLGDKWFNHREAQLTHCELLVVVQAAFLATGYQEAARHMPSARVLEILDRRIRERRNTP